MTARAVATAGLAVILAMSAAAQAAEDVNRPFHVEAGVEEKYDDLAIYVVDQTASKTYKNGDWITEPYLTLSYRSAARLPTKLVFDFTADIYAKYSIQDYETLRFLIRQAVDDKTAVAVKYTFIPYIFFGDDVVQAAPGSSVPAREQSHQIHIVQAAVDREVTPVLVLSATAKYGVRNAQPAFSYRDFTLWGGSIEGAYRLMPATRLTLGSSYERDDARGGTNAFTAPAPDDATYEQASAYAGLTHVIAERWLFKGEYAYRWRDYTTGLGPTSPNGGDTLHYGRRDSLNSLLVRITYQLAPPFYVKAGYESIWRDSTKSYARYHENIYSVGLHYRF